MTVICISIFALTSAPLTNDTLARDRDRRGSKYTNVNHRQDKRFVKSRHGDHRRHRRHVVSPRFARHGHVISRLPRGYRRAWYQRRPYFYSSGVFYRTGPSGFTVVRAPAGAIVVSLPVGYRRLWIDDTVYYAYGGTFYRRVPSGYAVVEAPTTIVVEEDVPVLVRPLKPSTGRVSVTASVLNVRSGPSLDDPVIYQIHEGYILDVHGKSNWWLYVQLPNGEFGWIKSVFTKQLEQGSG
jgi:hypothetical protein